MKVLELCKKIPRGKVTTYGELARAAGTSPRAVGAILSRNFDPEVPCHRVVLSDGWVGGYNRGTAEKIAKLKKEGVTFEGKRVLDRCTFSF